MWVGRGGAKPPQQRNRRRLPRFVAVVVTVAIAVPVAVAVAVPVAVAVVVGLRLFAFFVDVCC